MKVTPGRRMQTAGAEHHLGETGTKMRRSHTYKGYVIRADPVEIDPIHWTIEVVIERHLDEVNLKTKRYKATETRLTEDEAIVSSLEFGRRIVDGRHAGLRLP